MSSFSWSVLAAEPVASIRRPRSMFRFHVSQFVGKLVGLLAFTWQRCINLFDIFFLQ